MKLRLLGNKIRLRLSEPEVFALADAKEIQASLPINPFDRDNFRYSIHTSTETPNPTARFEHNELRIDLPWQEVKQWAGSDQVGIEDTIVTNSGEEIIILVEKDFKCLVDRGEDESSLFENPGGAEKC
jgi:hypothetical protein